MKAAIYNPYLDTLGGGERYTLAVATSLADKGYQVDIEWKDITIREKLEKRFGLNLEKINFISDVKRGDGYEVCFWVSDGSIPTLRARKNILHFQVPFHGVNGKTLLNRMKLFRISKIVCNSKFTKNIIDQEFGVDSLVIYPPVSINEIKSKRKENIIFFVGRFSQLKQAKRQDILVKAFKKLYDLGYKDWKLILAGGVEVGVGGYMEELKKLSEGYPIEIFESPDFSTIKDLYGKAKLFWSASGYGINEIKEPEKVEHFGITVVEAMAGGAVPLVFMAGGHKEIIKDGVNGFLWDSLSKLVNQSKRMIDNPSQLHSISLSAKFDCKKYSYERFEKDFSKII
jgi:glycosyltransferase involved in cell wall biosynthesis